MEERELRGTERQVCYYPSQNLSPSVSSLYDYKPIFFMLLDQAGVVKISIGTVGGGGSQLSGVTVGLQT